MTILANQVATFVQGGTKPGHEPETLKVMVAIYPAMRDARLTQYASQFQWAVHFDSNLTYSDGTTISDDDEIRWSSPDASPAEISKGGRKFPLRHVSYTFGPLAQASAYFSEIVTG